MQSLNGVQISNITLLFLLSEDDPAVPVFGTVIVPLTSMYTKF